MLYTFKAEYAVHESGTKYYQVLQVKNNISGDGCVITHWGSFNSGASKRPREHAKGTKVDQHKGFSTESSYQKAKRKKTSNGYTSWETTMSSEFDDDRSMEFVVNEWFSKNDAELIVTILEDLNERENAEDDFKKSMVADWDFSDGVDDVDFNKQDLEAIAAVKAKMEQESRQKLMQNKNWGRY